MESDPTGMVASALQSRIKYLTKRGGNLRRSPHHAVERPKWALKQKRAGSPAPSNFILQWFQNVNRTANLRLRGFCQMNGLPYWLLAMSGVLLTRAFQS